MSEKLFPEFNPVSAGEWKSAIEKELKGKSFDSLNWNTEEGFNVKPFYMPEDGHNKSSFHVYHKSSNPEIIENIDVKDIRSGNKKALEALENGSDSLHFILDVIDEKKLHALLKGILPEYISIHFTIKNNALQFLKWYRGITGNKKNIRGSINSIQGENNVFDIMEELSMFSSYFRGINIKAPDEKKITKQISFALKNAADILKYLTEKMIPIDEAAARIQFIFPVGDNYFFEIAKIRAMRKLWAVMVESFKPEHDCSVNTFIISEIASGGQSDKHLSFISNTSKVMSATIGGTDGISIYSEDDFSQRINRNIQLIVREETFINMNSGVADGSYYIDTLTEKIFEKVRIENQKIFS